MIYCHNGIYKVWTQIWNILGDIPNSSLLFFVRIFFQIFIENSLANGGIQRLYPTGGSQPESWNLNLTWWKAETNVKNTDAGHISSHSTFGVLVILVTLVSPPLLYSKSSSCRMNVMQRFACLSRLKIFFSWLENVLVTGTTNDWDEIGFLRYHSLFWQLVTNCQLPECRWRSLWL